MFIFISLNPAIVPIYASTFSSSEKYVEMEYYLDTGCATTGVHTAIHESKQ
jgi:hypothetical protein